MQENFRVSISYTLRVILRSLGEIIDMSFVPLALATLSSLAPSSGHSCCGVDLVFRFVVLFAGSAPCS